MQARQKLWTSVSVWLVIGIIFYLLLFTPILTEGGSLTLPTSFKQFNTFFLSISLEAIPFAWSKYLIIGAFVAALFQTYVSAQSLFLFVDR